MEGKNMTPEQLKEALHLKPTVMLIGDGPVVQGGNVERVETLHMSKSNVDRPEIDFLDVIRSRVAASEPIFITGNPSAEDEALITDMVEQAANEAGKSASMVQIVFLPESKSDK